MVRVGKDVMKTLSISCMKQNTNWRYGTKSTLLTSWYIRWRSAAEAKPLQTRNAQSSLALSSVIQTSIQIYYPSLGNLFELPPLTRLVTRRKVDNSRQSIIIVWTTVAEVPNKGQVDINHFVRLIPNNHVPSHERILCDTDSDNIPKPPKRRCVDDDIRTTSVNVIECADQIDNAKTVKSFMQCDQVVSILTDPTTVPLPSVPRGPKANTHFVIDNSQNCIRKITVKVINFGMTVVSGIVPSVEI